MTEEASASVDPVMNKLMALTIISDSNLYIDAENNLELQTHVYVNKHINKQLMKELKYNTTWRNENRNKIFNYKYEIDNKLFNIDETLTEDLYTECEIYATRNVMDTNIAAIVDSRASSRATNNSHMIIEEVEDGYLINSTIFISNHAWHTLVTFFNESHPYFCAVCGFEDLIVDDNEHILLDEHIDNMDFFKPIGEYDYIIRKIEDQYYCAVCNRCVGETSVELHLQSDFHNKNFDMALQKAFRIIQDDNENITDSETNTSTTNEVNKSAHLNKDIDKANDTYSNKYIVRDNDLNINNANKINDFNADLKANTGTINELNKMTPLNNNIVMNTEDDNDTTRPNDSYLNKCVIKDNDLNTINAVNTKHANDLNEYINWFNNIHEEHTDSEMASNNSISYATMAKKSKPHLPTSLDIDLGNKRITISLNSWNMMVNIKHRVYCMACGIEFSNNEIVDHIFEESHLAKLANFKALSEFEDHFIRKVNDKLCHCAHCNSLQYITDMESHIESRHPKKHDIQKHKNHENKVKETDAEHENRVKIETMDGASNKLHLDKKSTDNNTISVQINESITKKVRNIRPENEKQMIITNKSTTGTQNIGTNNKEIEVQRNDQFLHNNSVQQSIDNDKYNRVNDYNVYDAKVFYLNGDLMIDFMGCKIRIDHWSYNFVSKIQTGFFCKLCYVFFKDSYLLYHIHAESHMLALLTTHYNPIYACHLIRLLRNVLHCTICNIEFDPLQVPFHIMSQMHLMLLNKSIVKNATEKEPNKCECNSITANKCNTDIIPQASINVACTESAAKEDTNSNLMNSNKNFPNIIQEIKIENRLKNAPNLTRSPILIQAFDDISSDQTMPTKELDMNEKVYVKIKDMYNKVRLVNYHTLISIGDGTRQCCVCSININKGDLSNHINQCCHIENMERMKFVEKYEGDLIRQSYTTYHCTLCNIVANKRDIERHVLWSEHLQQKADAQKSTKRQRRNDVKSGIKQYICSSQKEIMFKDAREEQIVVKLSERFNSEMSKS